MRSVIVGGMVPEPTGTGRSNWVLKERGTAKLHAFGVGYEEVENGIGNFSTAIIEWPDGQVENVYVEHVKFID